MSAKPLIQKRTLKSMFENKLDVDFAAIKCCVSVQDKFGFSMSGGTCQAEHHFVKLVKLSILRLRSICERCHKLRRNLYSA